MSEEDLEADRTIQVNKLCQLVDLLIEIYEHYIKQLKLYKSKCNSYFFLSADHVPGYTSGWYDVIMWYDVISFGIEAEAVVDCGRNHGDRRVSAACEG